jgi:hypothetical protein
MLIQTFSKVNVAKDKNSVLSKSAGGHVSDIQNPYHYQESEMRTTWCVWNEISTRGN